ncbi:MAG: hypothetical protein NW237_02880 [Cyanobacteriota bacterium]|nr:hypothetical protein [Cyanobacteriota bacterium]
MASRWLWPGTLVLLALLGGSGKTEAATIRDPWDWVETLQKQARTQRCTLSGFLRSDPVPAPNGDWRVYSRLDMVASPNGQADRLTSVLFAENATTQELRVLYQSVAAVYAQEDPLDFIMVLPLAWQNNTLLAREFDGLFASDIAWDRALVWSPQTPDSSIQIWQPPASGYSEILGWDPLSEGRVLFRVGELGELPRLVSVGSDQTAQPLAEPLDRFPPQGIDWQSALPLSTGSLCRQE